MGGIRSKILELFRIAPRTGEATFFFAARSGYKTDEVVAVLEELKKEGIVDRDAKTKKWFLINNIPNIDSAQSTLSIDNSFNESLIEIVEDAVEQERTGEYVLMRYCASQHAITRAKVGGGRVISDNVNKRIYWLTLNTVGTTPFNENGRYVPRNSVLGKILQETQVGDGYEYQIMGAGINASTIDYHQGSINNTIDYPNNVINLSRVASQGFSGLAKLLKNLRNQARYGGELPQLTGKEYLRSFQNKTAQKKFAGTMTPEQSAVKFYNLYNDKSVIVEGGPGTGKTTAMVSRIGLLVDTVQIEENIKGKNDYFNSLNRSQKNKLLQLIKEDRDWMFFTPSNLIRQYMASSMNQEGLSKPFAKVHNWEVFRSRIMEDLGFFNEKIPSPKFRHYDDSESILMKDEWAIIQDFTRYYIQTMMKVERTAAYLTQVELQDVEDEILDEFAKIVNPTIEKLIKLFMNLRSRMGESLAKIMTLLNDMINKVTESIYTEIADDEEARQYILNNLKKRRRKPEEDDDVDEEQDDIPNGEEQQIRGFIRQLIEPYALYICKGKKLSPSREEAIEKISQYLLDVHEPMLEFIANYSQVKPMARLCQGVKVNILKDISKIYKDFRKQQLEDKSRNWDLELLNTIISESKNKDLHYQEQALLIGFINNLCKQVRKITQEADDHRYITCYLDNVRPVVGIDEATDFSIVEIYAMASFALPEFSSITLDGDLMQRLTNKGIRQWNDLENVLPNYQVLPLTLSFRQSVKMLNLARMLYKDSVGHDPVYSAKKDANTVPDPLAFINADEQEKLNWIEKRIAEIYDIYGSLPSTAIFLNDHEQEFKFAQDLGARKFFKKTGIKVVVGNEGENLAKENLVRVFSIEKVKGMEFDAVFFHNIDDTPYSGDLIKRFIYVGVSRAAFFLGITMSKKNKGNEGLLKYFDTKANWKYFE